ncbi:25S rRNA (uracil2843-N3)-methyltransferase [Rhodotorula paludigena]|uniref:25S rRNA (uracil2843-N3)-methyltransferase n=1 Tax=Rhodotorula paludigena TaxID=86838 RepID=UPI003180C5FD
MVQLNKTFDQLSLNERAAASGGRSAAAKSVSKSRSTVSESSLPVSTAQLLTVLSRLFSPLRNSPTFAYTLQHVKGLLYNKEYLAAFGTDSDEGERWREVYAARWVPARAAMYERILRECTVAEALQWVEAPGARELSEREELERERERARRRRQARLEGRPVEDEADTPAAKDASRDSDTVDVVMIGAGAGSEVVALGAILGDVATTDAARAKRPRVRVKAVDQGSWGELLAKMEAGLQEDWPSLAQDEQSSGGFDVAFVKGDILSTAPSPSTSAASLPADDGADLAQYLGIDFASPSLRLITICFTITELLLQSRLSTLRLLSHLSCSAPRGALLLVVESASLALIPLGKEGRTYPLGQLLDHALCGTDDEKGEWEIVRSEDAKWYRMPEGAEEVYNGGGKGAHVKLENSRVVLRLYKKR